MCMCFGTTIHLGVPEQALSSAWFRCTYTVGVVSREPRFVGLLLNCHVSMLYLIPVMVPNECTHRDSQKIINYLVAS